MAKPGFDKWLNDMQRKGKYKTKLRLEGYIKCMVDNQMHYIKGDYYLYDSHGNEIYNCIDENEMGVVAARRDILNILQEVYYASEPEKWQKSGPLYLDGKNKKQSVDTFNGTLLYVVVMLLLTIFNDRIIGWIGATVFYLMWKSSKYN